MGYKVIQLKSKPITKLLWSPANKEGFRKLIKSVKSTEYYQMKSKTIVLKMADGFLRELLADIKYRTNPNTKKEIDYLVLDFTQERNLTPKAKILFNPKQGKIHSNTSSCASIFHLDRLSLTEHGLATIGELISKKFLKKLKKTKQTAAIDIEIQPFLAKPEYSYQALVRPPVNSWAGLVLVEIWNKNMFGGNLTPRDDLDRKSEESVAFSVMTSKMRHQNLNNPSFYFRLDQELRYEGSFHPKAKFKKSNLRDFSGGGGKASQKAVGDWARLRELTGLIQRFTGMTGGFQSKGSVKSLEKPKIDYGKGIRTKRLIFGGNLIEKYEDELDESSGDENNSKKFKSLESADRGKKGSIMRKGVFRGSSERDLEQDDKMGRMVLQVEAIKSIGRVKHLIKGSRSNFRTNCISGLLVCMMASILLHLLSTVATRQTTIAYLKAYAQLKYNAGLQISELFFIDSHLNDLILANNGTYFGFEVTENEKNEKFEKFKKVNLETIRTSLDFLISVSNQINTEYILLAGAEDELAPFFDFLAKKSISMKSGNTTRNFPLEPAKNQIIAALTAISGKPLQEVKISTQEVKFFKTNLRQSNLIKRLYSFMDEIEDLSDLVRTRINSSRHSALLYFTLYGLIFTLTLYMAFIGLYKENHDFVALFYGFTIKDMEAMKVKLTEFGEFFKLFNFDESQSEDEESSEDSSSRSSDLEEFLNK